ncbi:oligosaccharide flippase family protein [Pelagibius litoralis]|uniref:Oligosaccharide flippase family protein n=1 Tax=Pelagibius litoralis TaxID=374515 RepID=A0A967EUU8_9PROT|nr:oligosaccharide flippase family protein [Pelagibius litoralis]NIA67731.1 oligosaccharide flippase family protein [Pelagibius litoralis]
MGRARKLIGQTIWASMGQFVQLVVGLIGLIILVRILGPETYGLFALGLLFINLAEVFVGGHAADGVVQKEDLSEAEKTATYAALMATGGLCASIIIASAGLVAAVFDAPSLIALLPVMAALPVLTAAVSVPNQLLVRDLRFAALAKASATASLLAVCVGIFLAVAGYGIWSLLWMELARRAAMLVLVHIATKWLPGAAFSRRDLWPMLRFAVRRIENKGLHYISVEALPRGFIGYVLGAEALGYFAVARRFLGQLNGVLSGPVSAVSFPAAARLQSSPALLERLIVSVIRVSTWTFWPALLGAIVIAPVLFPIMLGENWGASIAVMQILALAALRSPIVGFSTAVLTAFGAMGDISRVHIAAIVIGAIGCIIGIQFGLIGIAAALAFRQWLLWPVIAFFVKKRTGFAPLRQVTIMLQAAVPALVMAAAVLSLRLALDGLVAPMIELLVLIASGVFVYLLAWLAWNGAARASALEAVTGLLRGDRDAATRSLKAVIAP